MATVPDLKEEISEKKIQAEKEVTDGMSETVDSTVTDSSTITKNTIEKDTLDDDRVRLAGQPKGEILCKTPEHVQDSWEEPGQKKINLQETEIEMWKDGTQEKQAGLHKDGKDDIYELPVKDGQKDTCADVPVKITESSHDNTTASQNIQTVEIVASLTSSRDCQETKLVTTVENIKNDVQKSNVVEEILPSTDKMLKNGNIINSDLEKEEDNASESMVNSKALVNTEQRENKSVPEEDAIIYTDNPSALHVQRPQNDAYKKDERDAYAVEASDEMRKNQTATPSKLEMKENQVTITSEEIEIKVPLNSEMTSNFKASIEDEKKDDHVDERNNTVVETKVPLNSEMTSNFKASVEDKKKDDHVDERNNTVVETQTSDKQMLEESYTNKDDRVKTEAECYDMEESGSTKKSGSKETVSAGHFDTSITTISIENDLPDNSASYCEDKFIKSVPSSQGETATDQEIKSKEDFGILLASESTHGKYFQVEKTNYLAEVVSIKETIETETVTDNSRPMIDKKERMQEALPHIQITEEKIFQLNEAFTLKNVKDHILDNHIASENSNSEPSVLSTIKKYEGEEENVNKEELIEDRYVHDNLQRDGHKDEKLQLTSDTSETAGDDSGATCPENFQNEIKNDLLEPVEAENDTTKDKAELEETDAACAKSEKSMFQDVANSSIKEYREEMIQENNISIPGEDQISISHKLGEEIDVKDSIDLEIWREDCEKEDQNLNRNTEGQCGHGELVTQDSADKICNNSQESQLENVDKVPDTGSENQTHEKSCISSVDDGKTTYETLDTMLLRYKMESLNQESLNGQTDASSLPRNDETVKKQTDASFKETVDRKNDSSELCEEEDTKNNTKDSEHCSQDTGIKDLIEEEVATSASMNKLLNEIDASSSCVQKPLTETMDCQKEVEVIHARSEKDLAETVTDLPFDETSAGEKEVKSKYSSNAHFPEEGMASSIIHDEPQKEIMEDEKDHLVYCDQHSKTENVPKEIEDGLVIDDQKSITEHLVKEVHPTNEAAKSEEADNKSKGINESAQEFSNTTQVIVHSGNLKLASEKTDFEECSKDNAPLQTEDEHNNVALRSEPPSDLSEKQNYQSNKAPTDLMLDPKVEIQIVEGSIVQELPNKEYCANTTVDSDVEKRVRTESLLCEIKEKIDIQLKGTSDDVCIVAGERSCAKEVHINNTEEIILDGEKVLKSVNEMDIKCINGDQENKVKELIEEEETTCASGNKIPDEIDASPCCNKEPLIETMGCRKEEEAIHTSIKNLLAETGTTVIFTSMPFQETTMEEKDVHTMDTGSEQLPGESVVNSSINEPQKEITEDEKNHPDHSDQHSKTENAPKEKEDGLFIDEQVSVTEHLVNGIHFINIGAESQEADVRSVGIEESAEGLSNNKVDVVHSTDHKLDSKTVNFDQSCKYPLVEAEYEENTVCLQSELTVQSYDLLGEQTNKCSNAPVDLMLDPTGEIETVKGSTDAELVNKDDHATKTSNCDVETKDQTESLTYEIKTSSLENKDDRVVHNVSGGGLCAKEVHIKNTEDISLDGDTRLESVREEDGKYTDGNQDMVKEVEAPDRIKKFMSEETFIAHNCMHISPETHEAEKFASTREAQEEAREMELADYHSKQENIPDQKIHHEAGVGSENGPNSRTSADNEEFSRSFTYGEKIGDAEKQMENLNPALGDLPVVQTLFLKSLYLDDQKNDDGVEDPKSSRVEEVTNIGEYPIVEDPKEYLRNKNVQEIIHNRDEKETVQTSLDFLTEKEEENLGGVKVLIKGDTEVEQLTSTDSSESAERIGTETNIKDELTEYYSVEGMSGLGIDKYEQNSQISEITDREPQAVKKDSLNEIDTRNMEGPKVQELDIARKHSRKENEENSNGGCNDDNLKMPNKAKEGSLTNDKTTKVHEKMQNQTERDAQTAGLLHTDIVEEYIVAENLNSSEQNVNIVDLVKCKETKDEEQHHKNTVSVPPFLESAYKLTIEEKEKTEFAMCAAIPSIEGGIIEKEKGEAEIAITELFNFNTILTTNNSTSNEKGKRIDVLEGEERKSKVDLTNTKDMIFDFDLKKTPFMADNDTNNDKGDVVKIKMTYEEDLGPLVAPKSNKLNTAEEKDEGTNKSLSSLSTTETNEGIIRKDGQEVSEETSLVHNYDAHPNKCVKDESLELMTSQQTITSLLSTKEKLHTPKEEDACTVDDYLPVSHFLLNLINEEFPDVENIKVDNMRQEDVVPMDCIKTERTEKDNRGRIQMHLNNSSLILEEENRDLYGTAEKGNDKGMEELKKLNDSPNKLESSKDTTDDNLLLLELEESENGELQILNRAKEELISASESGNKENVSSTHESQFKKVYEGKTLEEESARAKNKLESNKDARDGNFLLSEIEESEDGELQILNNRAKEELTSANESVNKENVSCTHASHFKKLYEEKTLEEESARDIGSCVAKNLVQEVNSKEKIKKESNNYEEKFESQGDNKMANEAAPDNKASVMIQSEEIIELKDSINNKGTLQNTQEAEQTKVSHSEIYVDDLQIGRTDNAEKIKNEVAEDKTTKTKTTSYGEKESSQNLDAVEQKNPIEEIIIIVDKKVQSNVEAVDKTMEDQKTFSAIESAEVKCPESQIAREIVEKVLPEVKTSPTTAFAEAKDPERVTMNEEYLITSETVEKVIEEGETTANIKSRDKDKENFNRSEETAQTNQFQVAEVLGYVIVQGQKQSEIFESESEFVKGTEKEENVEMNMNIKERSSSDMKESYLSMGNQSDLQKTDKEEKNQNAESHLEENLDRKMKKDNTIKEENIEEAKNESSGQNVIEESCHETAPLIELKEGKHSLPNKKHGNILSGVRSKVKHSISSVKKAITCSSSVSHLIHEGN